MTGKFFGNVYPGCATVNPQCVCGLLYPDHRETEPPPQVTEGYIQQTILMNSLLLLLFLSL